MATPFLPYRIFTFLNLDVVLGALGMACMSSKFLSVSISLSLYFILGSVVWIIYTTDRILDTLSAKQTESARHAFHLKYRNYLVTIILFLIIINVIVMMESALSMTILKKGIIPSLMMMSYLLLKQWHVKKDRAMYWKEIFIAAGYAMGVLIPVISMKSNVPEKLIWMYCYIFCIAMVNVLVIGYYEKDDSKRVNDISLCHFLSVQSIRVLSILLTIIAVTSLFLMNLPWQGYFVPFFISIFLLMPLWNFKYFYLHYRYKNWSDGVFMAALLFCL